MSEEEPPMKKYKDEKMSDDVLLKYKTQLINSSTFLKAILPDEYEKPIPTTQVYVGFIKDLKNISFTVKILNEKLPLNQLSHLKRVRRNNIIISHADEFSTPSNIQEYMEKHVPELNDVFEFYREIDVPATMPKLRWQNVTTAKKWSCNFHPDIHMERLAGDKIFLGDELTLHRLFMSINIETVKWYSKKDISEDNFQMINASVVVDPSIKSVVAVSFDNRLEHPVQHSAMLAIDKVAKTQNGGAWSTGIQEEASLSGIDKDYLKHLKKVFPSINFGAKKFVSKKDSNDKDSLGPYLCTNYDIYMLREPCFMCAMALTHARIKSVFFCFQNKESGALLSRAKFHTMQALNHRYDVFTGFL